MTDHYKQTIDVYTKLGKVYLDNIAPIRLKEMDDFIRRLPKDAKVLDVGCAGGRDAKRFVQKGFSVIGIDMVDPFLREARKNVPKAIFRKMDIRKITFPQNSFDAVFANAVLVHVYKKDIPLILRNFYRILKHGGKLHISMKKGKGRRAVAEKVSLYHKRIFTFVSMAELKHFVQRAGFTILTTRLFPDGLGRKDVRWIVVQAEKI